MDDTFVVIVEIRDQNGLPTARKEIITRKLIAPEHIQDVGFNHVEQIDLLKNITDNLLPYQFNIIKIQNKCPECGGKTRKNGSFPSKFHTIFSDHKVNIQRITCKCGWTNKFTVEGLLGSACHPDLLKMGLAHELGHLGR